MASSVAVISGSVTDTDNAPAIRLSSPIITRKMR